MNNQTTLTKKQNNLDLPNDSSFETELLLVEDEKPLRDVLGNIINLNFDDLKLHTAENAEEALQVIEDNKIDLVVTDYMLPKMNGLQLLDNIKKSRSGTKSIMITAYGNELVKQRAHNAGTLAFLEKPFEPNEFLKQVEEVLEQISNKNLDTKAKLLALSQLELFNQELPPSKTIVLKELINQGVTLFKQGKYFTAENYWLHALRIHPGCREARRNLAVLERVLRNK